jgi:hypothetical protein
MSVTTRTEVVRATPEANGAVLFVAVAGEEVTILQAQGDRVNVQFPQRPPETKKGWLPKDAVSDGAAAVGAIAKGDFARAIAIQQGRVLVQGHYLAAIAQLRSKIADGPSGNELGVYRVLPGEWTADWGNASFGVNLPADPINNWRDQVAQFALMARDAQTGVLKVQDVTYIDLYLAQLVGVPAFKLLKATPTTSVEVALNTVGPTQLPAGNTSTAQILERYKSLLKKDGTGADAAKQIETVLDQALTDTKDLFPQQQAATKAVKLIDGAAKELVSGIANVSSVTDNSEMAELIVSSFAQAGYDVIQQIAALANAIAESGLNPGIKSGGDEQSFGLFQINTAHGALGEGKNPEDLKNPEFNIDMIIAEANKTGLKNAQTIEQAVEIFVRDVERPRDQDAEIARRTAIARQLMAA